MQQCYIQPFPFSNVPYLSCVLVSLYQESDGLHEDRRAGRIPSESGYEFSSEKNPPSNGTQDHTLLLLLLHCVCVPLLDKPVLITSSEFLSGGCGH